jgi:uncharacterized protein (UPF0261 family)
LEFPIGTVHYIVPEELRHCRNICILGTKLFDKRAQKSMLQDLQVAVSTTLNAYGCSRMAVNARA